jgi:LacI family transcriptional regulator
MKSKVTIRDVADLAQVSSQTVSRVINNRPDVADETRQRVRQAIEELNYQPNAIARSLIQQRSLTLGVITAGLQFIGPSQTLNGIAKQAEEMGYSLLLKELPHFRSNNTKPLINTLLARQVEGIIWAVPEIGDNREHLPEVSIPIIYLTMQERPDVSTVAIDNYLGGRMAAQHLIEQGYRHIAHLSGPLDWWESRQRQAGWIDALREAGLEVSDRQVASGNWSVGSGAQAMAQLVESYPEMDAVFVGNDQMALGAIHVAHQKGYQIPGDLGLAGFDGIPESEYFVPPLTTICQDLRELGSTAVRQLVQAIVSDRLEHLAFEARYTSLRPELRIRESSASVNR